MKFDVEKFKQKARPMSENERREIDDRESNRDWLALSAKYALAVRSILRAEKITQTELASRMGVSCCQVTKILSGKENLGLQTIAKVEKALGQSIVRFIFEQKTNVDVQPVAPSPYKISGRDFSSAGYACEESSDYMPSPNVGTLPGASEDKE